VDGSVIASFEAEMFEKSIKILTEFDSPEELAAFFEEQGIKADRADATSCAIAEYTKKNMGL